MFTRTHHWIRYWASSIQSTSLHCICLRSIWIPLFVLIQILSFTSSVQHLQIATRCWKHSHWI